MSHYIILQYPYETVQIALCKNGTIINSVTEHKFNAIKSTIPNIQALLNQNKLELKDLKFIAVNIGPGPYNTLRALLTMANGIHFVTKIPLIKCDALQLLCNESTSKNTVAILHAFLDHVFFQIQNNQTIQRGACSISELIKILQQHNQQITALGNGAILHKQLLLQETNSAVFPDATPEFNSLQALAEQSYQMWTNKNFDLNYAKPIYFEELKIKEN